MTDPSLTAEALRADVAETLGEPITEIGLHDDLIERGLDSIRLMSLVERWREQGSEVSFVELAETPTVTAWADLLASRVGS